MFLGILILMAKASRNTPSEIRVSWTVDGGFLQTTRLRGGVFVPVAVRYPIEAHYPNVRGIDVDLRIECLDGETLTVQKVTLSGSNGHEVSAAALKSIPVGALKANAIARVSSPIIVGPDGSLVATLPEPGALTQANAKQLFGQDARRRVTDEHLRKVAEVYEDAKQRGKPTTRAVQAINPVPNSNDVSRPTARRWISQARSTLDPKTGSPFLAPVPNTDRRGRANREKAE